MLTVEPRARSLNHYYVTRNTQHLEWLMKMRREQVKYYSVNIMRRVGKYLHRDCQAFVSALILLYDAMIMNDDSRDMENKI